MRESASAFGCHECGAPTRVLATRAQGSTIERKRECTGGHRFFTSEGFLRSVCAHGVNMTPRARRASREQQDEIFNLIAMHIARETVKRYV